MRQLTWDGVQWRIYLVTSTGLTNPVGITRVSQNLIYVADPGANKAFLVSDMFLRYDAYLPIL